MQVYYSSQSQSFYRIATIMTKPFRDNKKKPPELKGDLETPCHRVVLYEARRKSPPDTSASRGSLGRDELSVQHRDFQADDNKHNRGGFIVVKQRKYS
ncbi:hypothetical protein CEXT_369851 [Caerostris extrusa]|uniref:Uncharacterized protein n=1 Tax=Caerostris extrusa TaxID=172846 RepID=A0AAV4UQ55_CAEEX|nr:hypothetical protein CEXT_369851 [Caerostris extrusa]